MARFNFAGDMPRVQKVEDPLQYPVVLDFGNFTFKEEHSEPGVVEDIYVKHVSDFQFSVYGYPQRLQGYTLHPDEELKLPNPLPRGVKLYDPDPNREGDGACKVLALDWVYFAETLDRALREHVGDYTWAQANAV